MPPDDLFDGSPSSGGKATLALAVRPVDQIRLTSKVAETLYTSQVKDIPLELTFTNERLARLCNRHAELVAWIGDEALALEQLLAELDSVDKLGEVEEFPHVILRRATAGRVGAHGADEAGVLL